MQPQMMVNCECRKIFTSILNRNFLQNSIRAEQLIITDFSLGAIKICEIEDPKSDGMNQCTHLICPNLDSTGKYYNGL